MNHASRRDRPRPGCGLPARGVGTRRWPAVRTRHGPRHAVDSARFGLSLLEVLIAAAILAIGATSVMFTLSSAKDQWLRQDVAMVARLLATSLIESAVHRVRTHDTRYFKLGTPPDELARRAAAGAWKAPFQALAHPRTAILATAANPYFTGPDSPALPQPFDPDEQRLWGHLSYEVRVAFEMTEARAVAPGPIDSNQDGVAETDLARIEVEIFVVPLEGGAARSACKLTTLVAAHDKAPGAGALAEP